MTGAEYYKMICEKTNWPSNDLCDPPSDPREAIHVLIDHFLGEDWYVAMPENDDQVITVAICRILDKMDRMKKNLFLSIIFNYFLIFTIFIFTL